MAIIGKFNMIPTIPILFTIIILLFGVFIICLITGVVLDNSTVNTERRDDIKNLLTQVYHNQDMTLQAKKSEMKQAVRSLTQMKQKFQTDEESDFNTVNFDFSNRFILFYDKASDFADGKL